LTILLRSTITYSRLAETAAFQAVVAKFLSQVSPADDPTNRGLSTQFRRAFAAKARIGSVQSLRPTARERLLTISNGRKSKNDYAEAFVDRPQICDRSMALFGLQITTVGNDFLENHVMEFAVGVTRAALSGFWNRMLFSDLLARRRLSERLVERDRIARELHDTLLQGVQSLILRFQVVANTISVQEPSRLALENALARADELLAEGRARIKALRSTSSAGSSLHEALAAEGRELTSGHDVDFVANTDGSPRALHSVVHEEAFLIGREAVINAVCHSRATRIETLLYFRAKELRMTIRDNGCGFDPSRSTDSEEHWGLIGMRERADNLSARLKIVSSRGIGTEVDLRVPASVAYTRPDRRKLKLPVNDN
jgi:signal transduction histidine kinase